jgi:predicted DsbA family dithiol-disulfide isomerase
MEKAKIELFTSLTCPNCPPASKMVDELLNERDDIEVIKHVINSPEGYKRATEFEITSVPTILIKGPNIQEFIGLRGLFSKNGLNKAIDESLGKIIKKEEKKFFEKMKSYFKK